MAAKVSVQSTTHGCPKLVLPDCQQRLTATQDSRQSQQYSHQQLIPRQRGSARCSSICNMLRPSRQASKQASRMVCSAEAGQRHAVLHDFCLIIPYSSVIVLAGLLSVPFGAGWKGWMLAVVGAAEMAVSIKSLKAFQAEQQSTPYTATSAAISVGLTAHFTKMLKRQVAFWPKAMLSLLAGLSLAATGFLVYNLLAGGNPPKQDKAVTAEESMKPQKAY